MAVKSLIESSASSSEEESSSKEDHQLNKRKLEYESEETDEDDSEEESDESEDSDLKPKSVAKNPTEKAQEENDCRSGESDSEEEESDESEDSDPKPKSVSKIPTEKLQEEDGDGSEESDSEEEKSEKESYDTKPVVSNGNKKSQTEMTSPSATQVWELDVNNKSLKRKFSMLEEEVGNLKSFSLIKKLKFGDNVEKAEALEKKIRTQKLLEMKQELKRIGLINETFKLILEGFQK